MSSIFSQILILVAFILGFIIGKNHADLRGIKEDIDKAKGIFPKKYGNLVIDIDEAEAEKRDMKEEKEIINVADAIKYNDAQNN